MLARLCIHSLRILVWLDVYSRSVRSVRARVATTFFRRADLGVLIGVETDMKAVGVTFLKFDIVD